MVWWKQARIAKKQVGGRKDLKLAVRPAGTGFGRCVRRGAAEEARAIGFPGEAVRISRGIEKGKALPRPSQADVIDTAFFLGFVARMEAVQPWPCTVGEEDVLELEALGPVDCE